MFPRPAVLKSYCNCKGGFFWTTHLDDFASDQATFQDILHNKDWSGGAVFARANASQMQEVLGASKEMLFGGLEILKTNQTTPQAEPRELDLFPDGIAKQMSLKDGF